jgi:hypothetical protein
MDDHRQNELRRDIQYLKDRQAILDCLSRDTRGQDRHDSELITSCYWEDAIDEHGDAVNPASKYAAWINDEHAKASRLHTHNLSTHNCQIEGDVAHCETYVMVASLDHDGKTCQLVSGRYVDRLERRKGEWKIALRRFIVDVAIAGEPSMLKYLGETGYTHGSWNKHDTSYARPFELGTPGVKWAETLTRLENGEL